MMSLEHLVTAQDRAAVKKEVGRCNSNAPPKTWSASNNASPQGPQGPQGRLGAHAAHPKAKFVKPEDPHDVPAHTQGGSKDLKLVTVQEDGAVMKEWSAVHATGQDSFKSSSLFWEIRLKESRVRASEHEKHSKQSSVFQILEACDMLSQITGRDAACIDPTIWEQVKDMLFAGIFADYTVKSKKGGFKSRLDMLKSCVPYYMIAERQHADHQKIFQEVLELRKLLDDKPKATSFNTAATQTSTAEMNAASGFDALNQRIDQMQAIISEISAEKFSIKLDADEKVLAAVVESENLKDQLEHLTQRSNAISAESETIRADFELMRDKSKTLDEQNQQLWERSSGLPLVSQPHTLRTNTSIVLLVESVLASTSAQTRNFCTVFLFFFFSCSVAIT